MEAIDETPPKKDRKLGDEWRDWDGQDVEAASRAGKRLFFTLTGAFFLLLSGAALLVWYLVAPRLAQWHPVVSTALLAGFGLLLGLHYLMLAIISLSLLLRRPLPRPLAAAARKFLSRVEGGVFALGARLGVNRDRIAHSFVLIHNAIILVGGHHAVAEKILILLPRCLSKTQIQEANTLCADYGVGVAVVAGGELARQRIMERRPEAVVGVACERDLLSGIRDVRGRLCVLGIPNTRPHGPCKDTHIDLDELRRAIEFYLPPSALPQAGVPRDSSGPATATA